MNAKTIVRVVFVVLAALALVAAAQAAPTAPAAPATVSEISPPWWNIIQNPGFEAGSSNPDNWATQSYTTGAVFQWVSNQFVEGSKSVKITQNTANDARWLQSVDVVPDSDYVLSGWIKTSNVAHTGQSVDAGANLSVLGLSARTPALIGTNDWTYVHVVFNSGANESLFIYARLGYFSGTTTGTAWFDNVQVAPVKKLYISSSQSGTVDGVAFTPGDVLVHDPVRDTWAMYFDASDVGITKNVAALALYSSGDSPELLMSLSARQNVPGIGLVQPQDVLQFVPSSTGQNTAGDFYLFLDGRDAELTATSERIDALSWTTGWEMQLSTTGALKVTQWDDVPINARDEDMTQVWMYYGHFDGWDGLWFDGSMVPGLGSEDVNAAEYDPYLGIWYLNILGTGLVNGHAYTQKDVFAVDQSYQLLGRFWNGPAHGFNYNLDGFAIQQDAGF